LCYKSRASPIRRLRHFPFLLSHVSLLLRFALQTIDSLVFNKFRRKKDDAIVEKLSYRVILKPLINKIIGSQYYFTPNNRNGNIKIEPINLKITSSESPMILKGSNNSQSRGSATSRISASGQQSVNRINQSKMASRVFIAKF
jgi:hypothetical protein